MNGTPPSTSHQLTPLNPWELSTSQRLYVWLAAFFVSCLLIADIVGIKLFHIPLGFSFRLPWVDSPVTAVEHTCGMLTFPVTFLLTDLINEYYGKKGARRVTYIALAMAAFVFIIMNIAQAMPYLEAPYNVKRDNFDAVFGSAKVMYIASMCAFLVGQLSDIAVFGFLKKLTGGRMIWLRATGSTVISQLLDSFVVSYIAFSLGRRLFPDPANPPPAPFIDILKIAATGYTLKFVIAVAITPLIYAGHSLIHRLFGMTPVPVAHRA
jgi:uncharacterized integral membrane protein (TIGR00697 family)